MIRDRDCSPRRHGGHRVDDWGHRTIYPPLVSVVILSLLLWAIGGCQSPGAVTYDQMPSLSPVALGQGERLQVVATTSIVADVVRNVGGERIDLTTLMPLGTDPHAFQPTPQDAAAVADAHVVFANGAGLEAFLAGLLESAGEGVAVVLVSYGVELRRFEAGAAVEQAVGGGAAHQGEGEGGFDPHTWFDPNNVMVWTHNVERALSALDPGHAGVYEANAKAYSTSLQELDGWIRAQVARVPQENRKLVTDHASFSYFAHQYGFEQVGAVFPGYSTLAQPAARDLAALEDAIREFGVKAIFVGNTVNPALAEQVAQDTGTRVVFLYTGSLSEPGGPAGDYLAFMRYDVEAVVEALR